MAAKPKEKPKATPKKAKNKPSNGKGDTPRNCFSSGYKKNYDDVNWDDYDKELWNADNGNRPS